MKTERDQHFIDTAEFKCVVVNDNSPVSLENIEKKTFFITYKVADCM